MFNDSSFLELTQELANEVVVDELALKESVSPEKKKTNVSFFPRNFFQETSITKDEDETAIDLDLHQESEVVELDQLLWIIMIINYYYEYSWY
jgi:hypothetical protein